MSVQQVFALAGCLGVAEPVVAAGGGPVLERARAAGALTQPADEAVQ